MNRQAKRMIAMTAALLMLAGVLCPAAAEVSADTIPAGIQIGVEGETGARVYLRSAPSAASDELGTVRKGKTVFVIRNVVDPEDGSVWSYVEADGTEGYIRSEYITLDHVPQQAPEQVQQEKTDGNDSPPETPPLAFAEREAAPYIYRVKEDGTAEITGYSGTEAEVTVPYSLGGFRVTSIGSRVFFQCKSLEHVSIPVSVTGIEQYAFTECSNLSRVDLPRSLEYINNFAFTYCDALETIRIPSGVAYIGFNPFAGCDRLTDILVSPNSPFCSTDGGVLFDTIRNCLVSYPKTLQRSEYAVPDGTWKIGDWAFFECGALNGIIVPDSVTEIGTGAFAGCTSLTWITIPRSVGYIGEVAFDGCEKVTVITPAGSTAEKYCKDYGLAYVNSK